MKTFDTICAQGDVLFRKVAALPNGVNQVPATNGRVVVTHSETGHDHVMVVAEASLKAVSTQAITGERPGWSDAARAASAEVRKAHKRSKTPSVEMFAGDNPLVAWIKVNRPTALEHLRSHDTHEPIMFGPGIYEVRRQREYTPDGWRRVQD